MGVGVVGFASNFVTRLLGVAAMATEVAMATNSLCYASSSVFL